jgi:hypothetical protein
VALQITYTLVFLISCRGGRARGGGYTLRYVAPKFPCAALNRQPHGHGPAPGFRTSQSCQMSCRISSTSPALSRSSAAAWSSRMCASEVVPVSGATPSAIAKLSHTCSAVHACAAAARTTGAAPSLSGLPVRVQKLW